MLASGYFLVPQLGLFFSAGASCSPYSELAKSGEGGKWPWGMLVVGGVGRGNVTEEKMGSVWVSVSGRSKLGVTEILGGIQGIPETPSKQPKCRREILMGSYSKIPLKWDVAYKENFSGVLGSQRFHRISPPCSP